MSYELVQQVQILMNMQQQRLSVISQQSNYHWLSTTKSTRKLISYMDELLLNQAIQKVSTQQCIEAVKQLATWLEKHPNTQVHEIPKMCVTILNKLIMINVVNQATLIRQSSFRNSFRRLSSKVMPVTPTGGYQHAKKTIIYQISD